MDVFNYHKKVLDHVKENIADYLDVNRKHIHILSISEGEKSGIGETYQIDRKVEYEYNGEIRKALWIEYYHNGETKELFSLKDQE